ncbi:MAG: methyltransferase family protein [Candidatus Dormibacteria bacterium]
MNTSSGPLGPTARRPFLGMPVPWVFLLAFLLGVGLQLLLPVSSTSSTLSGLAWVAGLVLFAAGVLIAGWGLVIFHRLRTTTTPGETPNQLITSGPYRLTRNPMYVGLALAYLGEQGMLVLAWPLLFLPLAIVYVNWFVIPVEEASLRTFGPAYDAYRARVRRWI